MNEQELADLFSEQIDRMLQGERPDVPSGVDDLPELLALGNQISQTQFQASSIAQAMFQSQLASWFGLINGGSPMTILGLSKVWFVSIIVTAIAVVTGTGLIAVIVIKSFISGPVSVLPASPTATSTATEVSAGTVTATTVTSGTLITPTMTTQPEVTPTVAATATPTTPLTGGLPTLIFSSDLYVARLCQGVYTARRTLVNYGASPIADASLVWEVVEGAELIDGVAINSPELIQVVNENVVTPTNSVPDSTVAASLVSATNDPLATYSNYANFSHIAVGQDVKLDVKVKVKDAWWKQPDGTKIKVKLSIRRKIDDYRDHNRGHGNDPDGYDEDNPGHSRRRHDDDAYGQIVTIVKQGARWVTLTGYAHDYGDQTWLVDGHIVTINDCTGLPLTLLPGSPVEVIGLLRPDGTFVAINIIIINTDVTIVIFDSGVPQPGGSKGGGKGGSKGGGGGSCGGSKGNCGGSRGGSRGR
jgi:uncharacterized membrane protein YgcG